MKNNNDIAKFLAKFYLFTLIVLTALFTGQVNAQGSVEFSRLINNQIIEEGEALRIEALINDNDSAIRRVELSLDGVLVRAERTAPYVWRDAEISNLSAGEYTFTLVATERNGTSYSDDITLRVVEESNVELTFVSPTRRQEFVAGDQFVVEVETNGANDQIREISLFYDDDLVRIERGAPYQWGVDTQPERTGLFSALTAGEHTVRVEATLNDGTVTQVIRSISVVGNNTSEISQVSLAIEQRIAYELTEEPARYLVSRTDSTEAVSVGFDLSTDGVNVTSSEYDIVYADNGQAVRNTLNFPVGQTERAIEVRPIADEELEAVQGITLTLQEGDDYTIATPEGQRTIILDARNIAANNQNFVGIFRPIDGARTRASGVLSLVLRGDNRVATLNYSFDNLSSRQQDQFLEIAPSGVTFSDLPRGNTVTNFSINIAPGGIFRTSQEVLDALVDGSFFVRILSDQFPEGEIAAIIQRAGDNFGQEIAEETLTEQQVDIDIIRFLNQATFGATEETYNQLRRQIRDNGSNRLAVYEDWIDDQLDTRRNMTTMTNLMLGIADNQRLGIRTRHERSHAFWTLAINSPDQLRHRWAQSLSEILVISDDVNPIFNAHLGITTYWDMLAASGTGTYEDLLGQVTRHTAMGEYLSHTQNQKADPELGIFPDENYAREIMQLFSFGLVQLNQDGSLVLGDNNAPVPTYDNDVISEMARVFTGLSHSRVIVRGTDSDIANTRFNTSTRNAGGNQAQWTNPMIFFPEFHDFGRKEVFTDRGQQVIIGARSNTVGGANRELNEVMSALVSHSSTAPRLSRLLIQQLVTSNPSGAYIERVANAFGEDGDLRATIKAILLDQEARNPNVIDVASFGKQKSPLFQLTSFMRLTDMSSEFFLDGRNNDMNFSDFINNNAYDEDATYLRVGSFSTPHDNLSAESVFNFYSPDYSPPGQLANNSLVAPEMELLTESSLFDAINDFFLLIDRGTLDNGSRANNYTPSRADQNVQINRDRLQAIFDSARGNNRAKAAALVDYLDFYYNASQIALTNDVSGTRDFIIDAVANSRGDDRLDLALYAIAIAPESLVQK